MLNPECVIAIIAFAFVCFAICVAFKHIAFDKSLSLCKNSLCSVFFEILCSLDSISLIIFLILLTDFIGYFPIDVSPLNIKASAPSITEFATSFIPTIVKQGGKVYNSLEGDNFQKISTEFFEYAKKNLNDNDLEFDYDLRGRKYDKFMYFSQFERDEIDEELYRVRPTIYPIKNNFRWKV